MYNLAIETVFIVNSGKYNPIYSKDLPRKTKLD